MTLAVRFNQLPSSGIAALGELTPDDIDSSGPTLVQVSARDTAAPASTVPKPYLWDTSCPAPFVPHEESEAWLTLDVSTKMCWTSLQVSPGLASSISAITPETSGVALEVPPNVSVVFPGV